MARKTEGSALIKGPDSTEPALLMRMAIGPRAASAAVTCRLTSTTSVTSATPHPAASPAATAARSGASVRPITVTAAPARASAAEAWNEGSRHRRRPGRPLLRDPREEGLAADAHHRVRAQPPRRHLRLRRRVLRRDARHLRGVRPRELPRHRRPFRLLGRHRNPFPWDDAPHRRQRILRLLARHAVEDFGPARALARRRDQISVRNLAARSHHP